MTRETDARMVVDQLLKDAGWDIFDKSQVSTEEPAADGRADYLLKNSLTRPLCVVETKRFGKDPYGAKGQTLPCAQGLGAPFIILSNGNEHYFWDYGDGDARPVMGFPSQSDLETRANRSALYIFGLLGKRHHGFHLHPVYTARCMRAGIVPSWPTPTQREQAHDRASSRADTIRYKLDWESGILNGDGNKRKGMHWETCWRLKARHDAYVMQSLAGDAAKFRGLLDFRFKRCLGASDLSCCRLGLTTVDLVVLSHASTG